MESVRKFLLTKRRYRILQSLQTVLFRSVVAAEEKHARDPQILDLRGLTDVADYFFICSAQSTRQTQAIADHILQTLEKEGLKPDHLEGYPQNGWILLDFGQVVFHVFVEELRGHYDLEGLWCDAKPLDLPAALASMQLSQRALGGEASAAHAR